ncbi:dephospho-CoA kinase [Echinicola marina]|uniref:dephospho-CoA kinase n=1 Tax=Echinicola marina TaxID=2859768 RepID=UPI001CF6219F|nr:dephospho-CoA kinase [Echinicola marina]UCS95115.1 dephospho-CoA kinase [Echinicola marina]
MNNPKPLLVGITGGIGAGKSTAAKIFNILGIPVYSADDRAKWLMANDQHLIAAITKSFGTSAYNADRSLNKTFLAKEVFSDQEKTKTINQLVHPVVKTDFEDWASKQSSPYVLKEAALLFETGSYKDLDKVINISSPIKVRILRVLTRDPQRSEEQINAIIDRQLPDEKKNKLADFTIKNTDNKMLIPQVLKIHQILTGK